jgi:hypothetical protein
VFWGEWEPPSRIVKRWDREAELPTVVHDPYWESPGPKGFRENTDPWVFGQAFVYSNCKQLTPSGRPSALQSLPVGSLVLFGSTLHGRFVLDTAFVVGRTLGRFSGRNDGSRVGAAFRECTVRSLSADRKHAFAKFTLYQGATPTAPVNGMFCFVPCLPRDGEWPRFRRPSIELDEVNPASRQATSGANRLRRPDEVLDAWHSVAMQVLDAGLCLGCAINVPPRRSGSTQATRRSLRGRC